MRGITDGAGGNESYIQAERHDCEDCTPDAWVFLNVVAQEYGVDEACVHLRTSDARTLGQAMIRMADEIDARK